MSRMEENSTVRIDERPPAPGLDARLRARLELPAEALARMSELVASPPEPGPALMMAASRYTRVRATT